RRVDALGILANTLWTQGKPEQARKLAEQAVAEARELPIELPFGVAMTWAGLSRYLYDRDIGAIEHDMVELIEHGRGHGVNSEISFALSILSLCQAKRGELDDALRVKIEALRLFAEAHMETFSPLTLAHLAEAALDAQRLDQAADLLAELDVRDRNAEHF